MISAKDEAQSIKRIDVINPITLKEVKTCNDAIELCSEIVENLNVNISQFVIENNLYGYSGEVNIQRGIQSIIKLRDELITKKSVAVNIDGIYDSIVTINERDNFTEAMLIYGVYKMYLGEFSRGISIIEFSRRISNREDFIITNIEKLNEFIFKFNLSVDITKLNNLSEASDILESYYDLSMRIDKGDQLLIIIFDNLKKRKKSQEILESIYNVCNNALFHYELGKKDFRVSKKLVSLVVAISVVIVSGAYFIVDNNLKGEKGNLNATKKEEVATKKPEVSTNKPEDKKEDVVEAVNKKITLDSLKEKMASANKGEDYTFIDTALESLSKEDKSSKAYNGFSKEYNIKKQGFYYNAGRENLKNSDIKGAIDNFKVAYNNKTGEYLDPHITYSLACAVMKDNPKESIKYFEEYLKKYNKMDVSYEEESLYNLAMINMKLNNKSDARKSAQRLQDRYPDSMYNNEKLKQILN